MVPLSTSPGAPRAPQAPSTWERHLDLPPLAPETERRDSCIAPPPPSMWRFVPAAAGTLLGEPFMLTGLCAGEGQGGRP